jgi:DNA polymerase III subunit chi
MTDVTFHFNVPEPVGYACRLLRKATRQGVRVVVTGPVPWLVELNVALWTFDPLEFIAHCLWRVNEAWPARAHETPVWLLEDITAAPHHEVLINLGQPAPAGFEQFARLVEIVSTDPDDRAAARERLKFYKNHDHPVVLHDAAQ